MSTPKVFAQPTDGKVTQLDGSTGVRTVVDRDDRCHLTVSGGLH